jgi:hypothetical protein
LSHYAPSLKELLACDKFAQYPPDLEFRSAILSVEENIA